MEILEKVQDLVKYPFLSILPIAVFSAAACIDLTFALIWLRSYFQTFRRPSFG